MSHNIHTLDNFRKPSDDSSDDEHRPERFFVGGGRDSGQQVQGPDAGNDGDVVGRVMHAAQRAGAEVVNPEAAAAARAAGSSSGAPSGGYRLGGHGFPTEAINPSPSSSSGGEERPTFVLNLWTNGFSLDDGPLRDFRDPSSTEFLQQVMKGEMPKELVDKHGPQIDIHITRKMSEYVPPKPKPFGGQGHTVGGAPMYEENINAGAPLGREERVQLLAEAESGVRLDESQPVTRIQIRFPDNERLIAQFNHFHTVEAIRTFITTANPNYAYRPFQFIGGFPGKPIDDETVSLKDAGLINAVVTVKFV